MRKVFCLFLGLLPAWTADIAHGADHFSSDAQELLQLYQELHTFKDEANFHDIGFAICCSYSKWLLNVEDLTYRTRHKLIHEVGFLPGQLRQLGKEYMRSGGQPTAFTRELEAVIRMAVR